MKIGDFFVALGVKADTKVLTEFGQKAKSGMANVLGLKAAIIATGASFAYMANETFKGVQALENFERATGLSINKLQEYQRVAELSGTGLSGDAVAGQVQALQQNLTDLKFGGGNTAAFRLLGIDVSGKEAFEVMNEMRGAIAGLSDAEATNLIGKAGFSPEMLKILRMSNKEFDKMGKGNFMSAKGRKDVIEMGKAMAKVSIIFKEWKDQIVALLAGPVSNFLGMVADMMEGLNALGSAIYKIKPLFYGLAAVATYLLVTMSPMIATFALLYLVIEDLWVAFKGGESLSGDAFNYLSDVFKKIPEYLLEAWNYIKDIGTALGEWALDTYIDYLTQMRDIFKSIYEWVTSLSMSKVWKFMQKGWESAKGLFNKDEEGDKGASNSLNEFMKGEQEMNASTNSLVTGEAVKTASNVSNSNFSKTANVNNIYHINTTAPADDVAKGIAKQQTRELNYTHDEVG